MRQSKDKEEWCAYGKRENDRSLSKRMEKNLVALAMIGALLSSAVSDTLTSPSNRIAIR